MVEITHGHYKYIIGSSYTLDTLLKDEILIYKILNFFQSELSIKLDYADVRVLVHCLRFFDSYFEAFEFEYAEFLPPDIVSDLKENNFWHFYVGKIETSFFSYDLHLGFETLIEIIDENVYLLIE